MRCIKLKPDLHPRLPYPMLLTMPAPLFTSPQSSATGHGRTLAAVVVGVLLAHWLVLGQPLPWTLAWTPATSMAADNAEPGPSGPALQTRSILPSPSAPSAMAAQAQPARALDLPSPPRPQPHSIARDAAPKASEPRSLAAKPEAVALASNPAEDSVDIAQVAPYLIASERPSPPTGNPQPHKVGAIALVAAAATAGASGAALRLVYPDPARLKYDVRAEVKGVSISLNGELLWQHDGKTYNSRLEFSHFLLGSRVQTSKGTLGAQGLEPVRFGDKVRSEVAAHFDRIANKVTFSANTPDVPLTPGMQDQLSALLQVSAMLGGEPLRYPPGTQIPFEAIGPRSVESWTMVVGASERLALPGGEVSAIKITRGPAGPYSNRAEIWLAPSMGYLPVRIRLTETNGDVADKLWRSTQAP
ncbi:MAG: DUF3108 domain-containing protein [Curvibacter sp.]|nr:MAG: DUF3108 domain-containing protein [Curvibacter sp.]